MNHIQEKELNNLDFEEKIFLLNDLDISHEIRTPLTMIKGFVELLLTSTNLNFAQQQDLQIILKNEARLELIIQKIEKILGTFRERISNK